MRMARVMAVLAALVVCAWFVLGVRQARDAAAATALVSAGHRLSPSQAARARSLLDSAGTLNPDLTVDLLRGELASDQHHRRLAERIFAAVARREPLNLQAWSHLAFAAAQVGDRATLVRAARRVSLLYPPVR